MEKKTIKILLIPICFGMIAAGVLIQKDFGSTNLGYLLGHALILSSAGLFGASIGSLLTTTAGLNHDEELLNKISKSFSANSSLAQKAKSLEPFEGFFYIYRKTYNKDNMIIWICAKVKFININNMFLDGIVLEEFQASGDTVYKPHAYLTNDRRLIITESPTPEAEQTVVHIYPDTKEIHLDTGVAGIAIAETYVPNQRIVRPVILSKSTIEEIAPGIITERSKHKILDKHWTKTWVPHEMPPPLGPIVSDIHNHSELQPSKIIEYLSNSSEAIIIQTWTPDESALKNAYKKFLKDGGSLTVCLLCPDSTYAKDRSEVLSKKDPVYVSNQINDNLDFFVEMAQRCKSNKEGRVQIFTYNTLPSYPIYLFDNGLIIGHFWNETESNTGLQTEIPSTNIAYASIRKRVLEFINRFGDLYDHNER